MSNREKIKCSVININSTRKNRRLKINYRNSLPNLAVYCLAILVLVMPGISGADANYSRVFIFGDSLSDPGNVYAAEGKISEARYGVIPEFPYRSDDGHMFSNGITWAQEFTKKLGHEDSGKAALVNPGIYGNYAFGGARARSNSESDRPAAFAQIGMFLGDYTAVDSDALYVIQFGGNDVRDALLAAASTPDPDEAEMKVTAILQAAIGSTIQNIGWLYQYGARKFLVANVPNLSIAPAVKFQGPEAQMAAYFIVSEYNRGLEDSMAYFLEGIPGISHGLPGISIERLDIFGFTNAVNDAPGDFGIKNKDYPCLNFMADTEIGAVCEDPDEHLFWDGIHPTTDVHLALGEMADELLDKDEKEEDED